MSSNARFSAPKGFCAHHGIGFVMSEGCLDCNAKIIEAHSKNGLNASNLPKDALDIVSMRIFPRSELTQMITDEKLTRMTLFNTTLDSLGGEREYALLPGDAYIFFNKETRNKLYFAISNTQAAELTLKLNF